jgi:hypothetical protein
MIAQFTSVHMAVLSVTTHNEKAKAASLSGLTLSWNAPRGRSSGRQTHLLFPDSYFASYPDFKHGF